MDPIKIYEEANEQLQASRRAAAAAYALLEDNMNIKLQGDRNAVGPAILIILGCAIGFSSKFYAMWQIFVIGIVLTVCGIMLFILRARRALRHDSDVLAKRRVLQEKNDAAQEQYTVAVINFREAEREYKKIRT